MEALEGVDFGQFLLTREDQTRFSGFFPTVKVCSPSLRPVLRALKHQVAVSCSAPKIGRSNKSGRRADH